MVPHSTNACYVQHKALYRIQGGPPSLGSAPRLHPATPETEPDAELFTVPQELGDPAPDLTPPTSADGGGKRSQGGMISRLISASVNKR